MKTLLKNIILNFGDIIEIFFKNILFLFALFFLGSIVYFFIAPELDSFGSVLNNINFAQKLSIFFNILFLIVMIKNYLAKEKKDKLLDKILSLFYNLINLLKQIKENFSVLFYNLFLLWITVIVIAFSYNQMTNFKFEDHYLLHVSKLLTLFCIISIVFHFLMEDNSAKIIPKFINALKKITFGKFIFALSIYTIFIYSGLAQDMLAIILPFVHEAFIYFIGKIFTGMKGLMQFNPLGIGFFKKILSSYPVTLTRKSRVIIPYSNYSHQTIKLNLVKLEANSLNLLKQNNFIRNLLFSKPKFCIDLKNFNNLNLKNLVYLIGEKKLYISNSIILKNNFNTNVKVNIYLSKKEIYANFILENKKCVFVSSNKDFIHSINNLDRYSKSFEVNSKNLTLFNKDCVNPYLNLKGLPYSYQEITVNMYLGDTNNNSPFSEQFSNEDIPELTQTSIPSIPELTTYSDNLQPLAVDFSSYPRNWQPSVAESSNLIQASEQRITEASISTIQTINTVVSDNIFDPTSNVEILDWTPETEQALRKKEAIILGNILQIKWKLEQVPDGCSIRRLVPEKIHFDYLRFLLMAKDRDFRTKLIHVQTFQNSSELRTVLDRIFNSKLERAKLLINQELNYNLNNLDYKKKRWLEASLLSLCRYPLTDHWRNYITNPIAKDIIEKSLESIKIYDLQNNNRVKIGINKIINKLQKEIFPDA